MKKRILLIVALGLVAAMASGCALMDLLTMMNETARLEVPVIADDDNGVLTTQLPLATSMPMPVIETEEDVAYEFAANAPMMGVALSRLSKSN
ncbi:MAG: hypothetical protein IJ092_05810 [Atopobiaceae bacterium]|nr:hypothetical protein [Atopobiaceae bacterium]